jgi:hypothetical protein
MDLPVPIYVIYVSETFSYYHSVTVSPYLGPIVITLNVNEIKINVFLASISDLKGTSRNCRKDQNKS